MMRLGPAIITSASPIKSPEQRRNEGLAERVASNMADSERYPVYWDAYFKLALAAIDEFFTEYPEAL